MIKRNSKSKTVSPRNGQRYPDSTFEKALDRMGGMGSAANVAAAIGCRTCTANAHLIELTLKGRVKSIKRPGSPFRAYLLTGGRF